MSRNFKVYLLFKDRVGIVADTSALIARKDLNIISMEVERADDKARVYLEVENQGPELGQADVFQMLKNIPYLLEMEFVETLPQETRENRFRVVLDNIRDGVISIDPDGRVTTVNRIARKAFNCEDADVIGKNILELRMHDYTILEGLKGKTFSNVKKDIINENGRFQYFTTCRPITDSANRIVGAVEIRKDMREIKMLAQSISRPQTITFSDFIGESAVIKEVVSFGQKIARTDSIVSIRGETGTGKEVLARAIHSASERRGEFVAVDCAALPEALLESELFGYAPGAFTGARKEGKPGLFEVAADGTIFLDEIGEMAVGVQAKILRVIQEKRMRRIGGLKEVPLTCRIITATNKSLEQMVKEKLFREDLYYRINVLPIHIVPLRERVEDILLLAEHFLFQVDSRLEKSPQSVSDAAMDKLRSHSWPGNVRELKNVVERAAILCESEEIDTGYILFSLEIGKSSEEMKTRLLSGKSEGDSLHGLVDAYEKEIICERLDGCKSIRKAAKELGVSHTALLKKLKKHRIIVESNRTIRKQI
jgi:PAS domain S-box-containing protein